MTQLWRYEKERKFFGAPRLRGEIFSEDEVRESEDTPLPYYRFDALESGRFISRYSGETVECKCGRRFDSNDVLERHQEWHECDGEEEDE